MRFYKEDEEEKFAGFFSDATNGGSGENSGYNDDGSENEDLVGKQVEHNFIPLISDETKKEDKRMNIKVNHKDDIIESIDVECECGNKTTIIIDYNDEKQ